MSAPVRASDAVRSKRDAATGRLGAWKQAPSAQRESGGKAVCSASD